METVIIPPPSELDGSKSAGVCAYQQALLTAEA
jgi:hypothetical protein